MKSSKFKKKHMYKHIDRHGENDQKYQKLQYVHNSFDNGVQRDKDKGEVEALFFSTCSYSLLREGEVQRKSWRYFSST